MPSVLYRQLQKQLDQWSVGYPATSSGVEITLLKTLFAKEEAELFLYMSLSLEPPETICERAGKDPATTSGLLEQMAVKGLVFRHQKGTMMRYSAAPFVIGIYEYQVGRMEKVLAQNFEEYFEEAYYKSVAGVTSLLRPIPVNRSIETDSRIATYDDAKEILRKQNKIVIAPCICQVQQDLIGQGCEKPREVCFIFGSAGQYYIDNKMGRAISLDEAVEVLKKSHEAGLVVQPAGAQNPGGMCNCCGDCCAALRALKKFPKPAKMVSSNYFATVNRFECNGCDLCTDRCQMEAIQMKDVAVIDLDRCIGCGLCVTTCPNEAIQLNPKNRDQVALPPETGLDMVLEIAKIRNKDLIPLKMRK